ncbi:MAG: 50S ribosomal protein L23 [Sphingobacteriales bacterium]|jgi:large subunit ribosomal protein L23|nr:50S ribosomal protein L23 [Sphingobacteriales bacterium]
MDILKKPVVTEKMNRITEKQPRYGFIVDKRSNKLEIKKAVEAMYGVTVESVNTMIYRGKSKMRGTKNGFVTGNRPHTKKAIVTLKKGEAIDFFSNI